ncbi:IS110 family transposase, partial [Streptococcus hyovaginalis]
MLYVGIDVAKNKHEFTVLDGTGKQVLKTITFTNRKQGFELLHNTLKQLAQDCLIAMEDTGHYTLNLLKCLHEKAYQVYTYNPLLIKEFTKSLSLRKTKTDKKDARVIALKLVTDPNRELFKHDDKQEKLKILTRHVSRLKRHQTDWKVQYTKCLDILFPDCHQAVTKHSGYSYELLKAFPAPEKMIEAGFEKLMDIKRLT